MVEMSGTSSCCQVMLLALTANSSDHEECNSSSYLSISMKPGPIRAEESRRDAALAGTTQAPCGLPAHYRLAGAETGRLRALPVPRRVVSNQPVPHDLRSA